jgi:hypothetical protein
VEYVGRDEIALEIDELPVRRERDPNARVVIAGLPASRLRLSLLDSKSGEPACTLTAKLQGKEALLDKNQPCLGGRSARTLIRSGRVALAPGTLRLELSTLVEIETEDTLVDGKMTYTFVGTERRYH